MATGQNFDQALKQGLEQAIAKNAEEELAAALKRTEERGREAVAGIAARLVRTTSFERFGDNLQITVRFPEGGKT
jgi:ribose 1,5-bisphosphokinase PhnN